MWTLCKLGRSRSGPWAKRLTLLHLIYFWRAQALPSGSPGLSRPDITTLQEAVCVCVCVRVRVQERAWHVPWGRA